MLFTHYLAILVLPVLTKVIEQLMYNCLMDYLKVNNILYRHQFGFWENYRTHLALILIENKIAKLLMKENIKGEEWKIDMITEILDWINGISEYNLNEEEYLFYWMIYVLVIAFINICK